MTMTMTMTPTTVRRGTVSSLLARHGTAGRRLHWRLEDDWLLVSRPLNLVIPRTRRLELSRRNADLGGLVKFAGLPGRRVEVRAEIPLDAELDLGQQIDATVRGFDRASAALRRAAPEPGPAQESQRDAEPAADLAALCTELGVAFTERDDGALIVELPGATGLCGHARLEQPSRTGFRAGLDLGNCDGRGPESQEALGVLLLAASATVRLARAVVRPGADAETVAVEVCWPTAARGQALEHALAALTTVGQYFGREVDAICDRSVARAYLDQTLRYGRSDHCSR